MRQRIAFVVTGLLVVTVACGGDDDTAELAPAPTSESAEDDSEATRTVSDPDDADGDGVTDDNCPGVFNPRQTDTDGDGIGDLCEDDLGDLPDECGIVEEADALGAALAGDSGDSEDESLCISVALYVHVNEEVDGIEVVILGEDFVIIDVSPAELEQIRDLDIVINTIDQFAIADRNALITARLDENPAAIATADPGALATLDPDVFQRIPGTVLAEQDDAVLKAIPDEFWLRAEPRVLDLVRDRLVRIDPEITFERRRFETLPPRSDVSG